MLQRLLLEDVSLEEMSLEEVFQGKRRIGGGGLATTSPENQNDGRMVVVVRPVITCPIGGGTPKRDWSGNCFGKRIMPKRRGAVQTKRVAKTNTKGPTPGLGVMGRVLGPDDKVWGAEIGPDLCGCEYIQEYQGVGCG